MVLLKMKGINNKPFSTWALLASLYVTQYLGTSFIIVALVAILRQQGASLDRISLIYLLGMLGACKFLWAPLVDRFRLTHRQGHYQGWLLLTQSGMAAVLVAIGMLDVITDFSLLYTLCLLLTLCYATQDIAVDGLACRLLTPTERGIGNGLQTAGGLLSWLIGGGLVLILYPHIGWRACLWMLAAGTAVSLIQLSFFREPTWRRAPLPGRRMLRFITFWRHKRAGGWLLMLLCYATGIAGAWSILIPVLIDAGWAMERIGLVVNMQGTVVGFISALLTGWLIRNITRRQALVLAALSQIIAVAAIALPVQGYTSNGAVTLAVCVYFFCYNPAMTVISTLMMDQVSPETPATDYTLQFSLYQIAGMSMSACCVYLAGRMGYTAVHGAALCAALLVVFLSLRYMPEEIVQHEAVR